MYEVPQQPMKDAVTMNGRNPTACKKVFSRMGVGSQTRRRELAPRWWRSCRASPFPCPPSPDPQVQKWWFWLCFSCRLQEENPERIAGLDCAKKVTGRKNTRVHIPHSQNLLDDCARPTDDSEYDFTEFAGGEFWRIGDDCKKYACFRRTEWLDLPHQLIRTTAPFTTVSTPPISSALSPALGFEFCIGLQILSVCREMIPLKIVLNSVTERLRKRESRQVREQISFAASTILALW